MTRPKKPLDLSPRGEVILGTTKIDVSDLPGENPYDQAVLAGVIDYPMAKVREEVLRVREVTERERIATEQARIALEKERLSLEQARGNLIDLESVQERDERIADWVLSGLSTMLDRMVEHAEPHDRARFRAHGESVLAEIRQDLSDKIATL